MIGSINYQEQLLKSHDMFLFQNNAKNAREGLTMSLFGHGKNVPKKSHSAENIEKGDPLILSGFVGYVKKVKNQRGTL